MNVTKITVFHLKYFEISRTIGELNTIHLTRYFVMQSKKHETIILVMNWNAVMRIFLGKSKNNYPLALSLEYLFRTFSFFLIALIMTPLQFLAKLWTKVTSKLWNFMTCWTASLVITDDRVLTTVFSIFTFTHHCILHSISLFKTHHKPRYTHRCTVIKYVIYKIIFHYSQLDVNFKLVLKMWK